MKLVQIPFSHNCIKVRIALQRKNLDFEVQNIKPTDRRSVLRQSGQGLVPVLIDGDEAVSDSTAILLHLEKRYPAPPLIPTDPGRRAECLLTEDWADRAFMAVSRRIAYFNVLNTPGRLGALFFPRSSALTRRFQERVARRIVSRRFGISAERHPRDCADARAAAAIAVERIGAGPSLFEDHETIADIALATMSAPLAADRELAGEPAVNALLAWGEPIIGPDVAAFYRGTSFVSSDDRSG